MDLKKYERGMTGLNTIANAIDSGWTDAKDILDDCDVNESDIADIWFEIGNAHDFKSINNITKWCVDTIQMKVGIIHKGRIIVNMISNLTVIKTDNELFAVGL